MGGRCGNTIMHTAVQENNAALVAWLCQKDKDLIRMRRHTGCEPLYDAVCMGHLQCVAALLKNGADANAYTFRTGIVSRGISDVCFAGTPLELALQIGDTKIAAEIRKYGGECMNPDDKDTLARLRNEEDAVISEYVKRD